MTEDDLMQRASDRDLLYGLASVHLMFGMHETALNLLELSNLIYPNDQPTLKAMARVCFRMRTPKRVLELTARIEQLEGGLDAETAALKGRALAQLGQGRKAIEVFNNIPPATSIQTH